MDSDYDDSSGDSSEAPAEKKKDEAHQTALLPKSFFPGKDLSVGKTCKVRVERLMEDEVAVSYVRHDSDKPKTEPPSSSGDYD